jgi:hypothetical protein
MSISGVVDQRPGDGQPPLEPTGQLLDPGAGFVGQLHEVEQLVGAACDLRTRQAEEPAVHQEVLPDRQLAVQGVILRADPDPGPDLRPVALGVEAEYPQRPAGRCRHRSDHPHGRRLPGTVGAEKTRTPRRAEP